MGRFLHLIKAEAEKTPFHASVAALPRGAEVPGLKPMLYPLVTPEMKEFQRRRLLMFLKK